MRPVSQAFLDALQKSHRAVIACEVVNQHGDIIGTLNPVDGQVDVDITAAVRRSCRMTLVTEPGGLTDLLNLVAPRHANELRIRRGIAATSLGTADDELVELGVFSVADLTVQDSEGGLRVDLSGYDRAWRVQRAKPADALTSANYTRDVSVFVMNDIIRQVAPWLPIKVTPTGKTLTGTLHMKPDSDPWATAQSVALAARFELFIDATGTAIFRARQKAGWTNPIFEIVEGGLLLDAELGYDLEHTWNTVVVANQPSDEGQILLRAKAEDLDPASATYTKGPLGPIPLFHTNRYIATQDEANRLADLLLDWAAGWQEEVSFSAVPNPALDEGDWVTLRRVRMGIDAVYQLERLSIPLGVEGAMTGSAQRRVKAG